MLYELRYWRALLFDENAMIGVRTCATRTRAVWFFIAAVALQVLPVNRQDIALLPFDVPKIALMYFGFVVLGALLGRALGARSPFHKFVYTTSTIMTYGGIIMALLTYISIVVFEILIDNAIVTNIMTSIIPYYYIVLFAYSIEVASQLKNQWKRIALAIVSICVMYGAYFFI